MEVTVKNSNGGERIWRSLARLATAPGNGCFNLAGTKHVLYFFNRFALG